MSVTGDMVRARDRRRLSLLMAGCLSHLCADSKQPHERARQERDRPRPQQKEHSHVRRGLSYEGYSSHVFHTELVQRFPQSAASADVTSNVFKKEKHVSSSSFLGH